MSSPALLQATMSSVRKRGTLILGNLQKNIHKIEENAKRIYVKIKPFLPQFMSRPWWSMYDHLVYNLNILVPDHDPEKILKVDGYFIQAVHIGRKVLWRSVKDEYARLNDHMRGKLASRNIEKYVVIQENEKFLPVLDPHSSFQKRWDIVMLVLLGFTALVIPFETAFVKSQSVDILFLVNILVDILFVMDMFVQCITSYKDSKTNRIVTDHGRILLYYAKTWLFVDLFSNIPFDVFGIIFSGAVGADLNLLRLLRFLRLSRLFKLLRIFRASKKLKQWQTATNLELSTIELAKLAFMTVTLTHWLACAFKIIGDGFDPSEPAGWPSKFETQHVSGWFQYLLAIYWAAGMISLTGNTSVDLRPTCDRELAFTMIVSLLSYGIALYFIATVTDVLNVCRRESRSHEAKVDQYLGMFKRLRLNNTLRSRVNDYLENFQSMQAVSKFTNLLQDLPPQLHAFITVNIFIPMLESIPYIEPFLPFDPVLMQELAKEVEIRGFPPHSLVFSGEIDGVYYIENGVIAMEGRVYCSGASLGFECLRAKRKKQAARALTLLTVYFIPRDKLAAIVDANLQVSEYAKKWTAWRVFQSYIRTYSKLYYKIAIIGPTLEPPATSRRPFMRENEDDDVDVIVKLRMDEIGF